MMNHCILSSVKQKLLITLSRVTTISENPDDLAPLSPITFADIEDECLVLVSLEAGIVAPPSVLKKME